MIVIESQRDCSGKEEDILLLFRRECRAPRDHKDTHERWFPVFSRFWLWCIGRDLASDSARRNINWTKFCHYKSQGHRAMEIKGTLAIGMDSMENAKWLTQMKYHYLRMDVIFASSKLSKLIDKPSFGKGKRNIPASAYFLPKLDVSAISVKASESFGFLSGKIVLHLLSVWCLGGRKCFDQPKQIMVLQGSFFLSFQVLILLQQLFLPISWSGQISSNRLTDQQPIVCPFQL